MGEPVIQEAEAMETDEVTDTRRRRDEEIAKLFKVTDLILAKLPATIVTVGRADIDGKRSVVIDIDYSDDIAGILSTVFTAMRKKVISVDAAAKYLDYKATIETTEISIRDIVTEAETEGIAFDFMMAIPIMNLLTCFKAFFDEVRTGVTKFQVREEVVRKTMKRKPGGQGTAVARLKPEEKVQSIGQFGLTNQHIPLLQGITLPPERRTGLMRSLGPLAQCIMLVNETTYPDKLTQAVKNSLAMLPMAAEIATCLKDARTPGAVQGVLCELGDILLLSTARSTQKIYFPLMFAKYLWSIKGDTKWNFAGAQMQAFITDKIISKNIKFRIKTGGEAIHTAEAIFHAMFGTYLEDLGILSQITNNGQWDNRKLISPIFLKRSTKTKQIIHPITLEKVSKMAQSLLSQNMGNVDPCYATRPSFSGKRRRIFSTPLVTYLKTGRNISNYSTDPLQLQMSLKSMKDQLVKEMDNGNLSATGTTKWLVRGRNGTWTESDEVIRESGISFYGAPPIV